MTAEYIHGPKDGDVETQAPIPSEVFVPVDGAHFAHYVRRDPMRMAVIGAAGVIPPRLVFMGYVERGD